MTSFEVKDDAWKTLKDKVIIVTGGSSGIGLATVKVLLSRGAKVVVGDVHPEPHSPSDAFYQQVDVRDWASQLHMFKQTIAKFGRIDHVFANAGIVGVATYFEEEFDKNGDLLPPDSRTLDVNLVGVIYTCKLALHFLKKNPEGGSIVITASAASLGPFALTDYNVSKHGVLGLMRGLNANLAQIAGNKIRVNCVAPLWTATGMVPEEKMKGHGVSTQSPSVVADCAAGLMADEARNGQVIYSRRGECKDVEGAILERVITLMDVEAADNPADEQARVRMNEMLMGR